MEDFLPLSLLIHLKPAQTVAGIAYNLLHTFFQISDTSLYRTTTMNSLVCFGFFVCLFFCFVRDYENTLLEKKKTFTSCWNIAGLLIVCEEEEGQMSVIQSTLNYFTHVN